MFESNKKSKVLCAKRFCVCLLLSINLVIFFGNRPESPQKAERKNDKQRNEETERKSAFALARRKINLSRALETAH